MIDLDELQRMLEKAAEPEPSGDDSYYIVETFKRMEFEQKLDAALRNAAPELIAMARRYQWLRDKAPEQWATWADERDCDNCDSTEIDAAIDAAMQEQKP